MLYSSLRIMAQMLPVVALLATAGLAQAASTGLQPGARIPSFSLKDQRGLAQTFDSLKGPNGLVILFNRSADWCPFCKAQLIDLEGARKEFEAKGVHVVSVTYDSPDVLSTFAKRRGIHFEMLSDPNSAVIKEFGVLNPDATADQAGIAIPNYFWIAPDGVIRHRLAEAELLDRASASYFYQQIFGGAAALERAHSVSAAATPHVKVALGQTDVVTAPGTRIRLWARIEFDGDTHLYAPGAESLGYHSVKLSLNPAELYGSHATSYPTSTVLNVPSLGERIPVFEHEVLIAKDIWPIRNDETVQKFAADPTLVVRGVLEYQACTNTTCFAPTKVPVEWTVEVRASDLDGERVPEPLRRK